MATKPLPVHGADISHHQRTVDLAKAKAAGLDFLFHKATQGASYVDDRYAERRDAARKLGLPFGAYHFAEVTPRSGPVAQAQRFLAIAGVRPGDMRPMLDLEDTTGSSFSSLSVKERTAWVGAFVGEVKKHLGVEPFIYTPFELSDHFGCPLWVARYSNTNAAPNVPKPWSTYTLRQFTNGVYGVPKSFPGLGNVDLNTWNGDPARLLGIFRVPAPKPTAPAKKAPAPKPPAKAPKAVFNVVLAPGKSTPDMPRSKVVADGRIAGSVARPSSVVGITESTKNDTKDFGAALSKLAVRNPSTECPIWLGAEWTINSAKWVPIHGSFRAENPKSKLSGVSPARGLTVVEATHKASGKRVAFVLTHFVSKANNRTVESAEEWRRAKWDQSWKAGQGIVKGLIARDIPVVYFGDFNTGPRKTGKALTKTLPAGTVHAYDTVLDHVWVIPSKSHKVSVGARPVVKNINSDHNLAIVSVTVS